MSHQLDLAAQCQSSSNSCRDRYILEHLESISTHAWFLRLLLGVCTLHRRVLPMFSNRWMTTPVVLMIASCFKMNCQGSLSGSSVRILSGVASRLRNGFTNTRFDPFPTA